MMAKVEQYSRMSMGYNKSLLPFFALILFLISPFIGCMFSLYNISKNRFVNISYVLVVLFAGLYGYTYLPYSNDDITRHYQLFKTISSLDTFSDFVLYQAVSFKPDFLIDYLYWIVGHFSDNHQLVGFLGSAMYYGLLLAIIRNWLGLFSQTHYGPAFWCAILSMLALIPTNEFCGMRQGNANALLLFFITWPKFYNFPKLVRILLLILPCLLHFSIFPYILIFVLASNINSKKAVLLSAAMALSCIFVVPVMQSLMGVLPKLGTIGVGIAMKIDEYMFDGDIENLLYSGSRLRFYFIVLLIAISPFMFNLIRKAKSEDKNFDTFIRFTYLTLGYLVFTSPTFILSRSLMIFKLIACLLISYLAFSSTVSTKNNQLYKIITYTLIFSGVIYLIQAQEYRVINPAIFYLPLPELLQIETDIYGYHV
jgi:hypothetical protein